MFRFAIDNDAESNAVGIRYFLNDGPSFVAFLKQRYVDFIVREVGLDGEISALSNLTTLPGQPEESKPEISFDEQIMRIVGDEEKERFKQFVEMQIQNAFEQPKNGEKLPSFPFTFDWNGSKEERMKIHKVIKEHLPRFESSTVNGKIVVKHLPMNRQAEERWPKDRPPYLSFILYKENIESNAALKQLSEFVGAKQNRFSIAGNKDKRGVTAQRATCYKLDAAKLLDHNTLACRALITKTQLPSTILLTGNYEYVNTPLSTGRLQGNRFVLTLRSIKTDTTISLNKLAVSCVQRAQQGFVNYFGLQRFGTTLFSDTHTHHVGAALLRSEWQNAAELIIKSKDKDGSALNALKKGKLSECLEKIPKHFITERLLISSLIKSGSTTNFRNAFDSLPKQARMIYLHAFCSYVFNECVSYRLSLGQDVIRGDLVRACKSDIENEDEKDGKSLKRKRVYFDSPSVHAVDEKDIEAKKYSLYDVVLPLPGASTTRPQNVVGDYYLSLLKEIGVTEKMLQNPVHPSYSLSGDYREVLQRAFDVSCEVVEYEHKNDQLVITDKDLLMKSGEIKKCSSCKTRREHCREQSQLEILTMLEKSEEVKNPQSIQSEENIEKIPNNSLIQTSSLEKKNISEKQKLHALILEFTLPKSSYATMLYRELFKQPTSTSSQKKLDDENEDGEFEDGF